MANEAVAFAFFLAESLNHAQRAEHFLHNRESGIFKVGGVTPVVTKAWVKGSCPEIKNRCNTNSDPSQLPIECRGDVSHADDRRCGRNKRNGSVNCNPLNRESVVLNSVHRIGSASRIVI